jgi:hypothetical protein
MNAASRVTSGESVKEAFSIAGPSLPRAASSGAGGRTLHQIQLQLRELPQLFNSMDATPFHHRDLDRDAEEFIESWALEFPARGDFAITILLENFPAEDPTAIAAEAIHNYFNYKEELARRELVQLLQRGRVSLVIGLSFLGLLLGASDLINKVPIGPFTDITRESLTIGGWVAMWRPLQILLYDWWPIVHRRRIYRSLGKAQVSVLPQSVSGLKRTLGQT